MFMGYCGIGTSGNAPPSPKSYKTHTQYQQYYLSIIASNTVDISFNRNKFSLLKIVEPIHVADHMVVLCF